MSNLYLAHHGIKGQKWGYRRWQNSDGTLTPAGKEHYSKGMAGVRRKLKEGKIRKLERRLDKQERWLNDPKNKAKLAKANAKSESYKRKQLEYKRRQDRADRAIFFKDFKQNRADRAYRRMSRANPIKSQKFIERYSKARYDFSVTNARRDKAVTSYIKRYTMDYYDRINNE